MDQSRSVKQARLERGLTRWEVARLTDIEPGRLASIEHGKLEPTVQEMRALARVLALIPHELDQ